jgi:arginase
VRLLPDALLAAGLADGLDASRSARVVAPASSPIRDPQHGMLNTEAIAGYTLDLSASIGSALDRELFPIVLGGDCSIVLGGLLALRRRGRFGLLFADGHADFYQPEANVNGEAASSDLALATGRGPKRMTQFQGYDRLVRDEDTVVFGFRDAQEQADYGSQPLPPEMLAIDLATVRELGIQRAVALSLERLQRTELAGFWIHLDADVLSDTIMPAVDYRIPDGLSWDELIALLRLTRDFAVGLEITIYNPELDPDRAIARAFTDALVQGLKG